VLARLNQIGGVQGTSGSIGHEGGALVQVSVRPGADADRVAAEVRRVLADAVRDRSPVQLGGREAAAALRQKEWLDPGRLAEVAANDPGTTEGRGPALLAALLAAVLALALGLLALRRLRQRRAGGPLPGHAGRWRAA
jgi:hypothetical protein